MTIPLCVTLWLSATCACSDVPGRPCLHILPRPCSQSHKCAVMVRITARVCAAPANKGVIRCSCYRIIFVWTNAPAHTSDKSATTSPRTPRNPAPASSVTLSKSERHHSKCLRMVGAPTYPNDGDYPAHSSTQRSSKAPTARPQGQQRSEASSQTSSSEAQRGSGTATRPAAPPPLLRIAAAPQPQHRR